jgi:small subunit ribosomal protein S1
MSAQARNDKDPLSAEIDAALAGVNLQEIGVSKPRQGAARELMRGQVVGISGADVFVELGPRMQGVAALAEFDAAPKIGDTFEFKLNGREDDLWKLSRRAAQELTQASEIEVGALVKARVTGQNTGGLELRIGPLAAFMPTSLVGLKPGETLAALLTQTLVCEVLEIDPERRRVLLSRRALVERERDEQRKESVGRFSVGQRISGKVARVEPFGAFVELGGGLEGLVHVSNISRKRVENAGSALKQGDTVEVVILEIKDGGKRIGLSMKALEPDPWEGVAQRYSVDMIVNGKVTRLMDFGAFVELEPGLEGLLHVSQLGAKERVRRPSDLVKPGQELAVRISAIEPERQRLSLSRLDSRGALLGSEESVDAKEIDQALNTAAPRKVGTNLGALLGKALNQPPRR